MCTQCMFSGGGRGRNQNILNVLNGLTSPLRQIASRIENQQDVIEIQQPVDVSHHLCCLPSPEKQFIDQDDDDDGWCGVVFCAVVTFSVYNGAVAWRLKCVILLSFCRRCRLMSF